MTFTLTITTDNAAFHGEDCPDAEHYCGEREAELARILNKISELPHRRLRNYDNRTSAGISGWIDDVNGNQVGYWELSES